LHYFFLTKIKYKGYTAHVVFDDEAKLFHGEVIGIKDVITFQGESVKELEKAFKDSVEDYLDFCRERGEKPEKPYSGRFNLRITPELHARLDVAAKSQGESLNSFVAHALERAVG